MADFFAGILFTLVLEFMGWKIYQARQRRKNRDVLPPSQPRPGDTPRDFVDRNERLK